MDTTLIEMHYKYQKIFITYSHQSSFHFLIQIQQKHARRNSIHNNGECEWTTCLDSHMPTCFGHKNMTEFDILTFRCYFLQNNISISNSSILSCETLELSSRYLPATVKDHIDNITWIYSSYIINTLSQNVHILERKRNDIFKHMESLKIHEHFGKGGIHSL